MKHVKMLSAAAVAAIALTGLVGAGSASATALYNGGTKLGVGSTLDFSNSGNITLKNTAGNETLNECTGSTIKASITNAGGAGTAVQSNISELTWTGCTVPTTTDAKGGLEFTQIGTSTEGTVKVNSEIKWTINTVFFGVCSYGAIPWAVIGRIVRTVATHLVIEWIVTKLSGSNFACPETGRLVGKYVSTTPTDLRVEAS